MFGLGFSEIFFILLIFVVFVKPDNIPEALRKIAYYVGKFKGAVNDARVMMEDVKDMGNPKSWAPPQRYEGLNRDDDLSPAQRILAESEIKEVEIDSISTENKSDTDLGS